MTAVPEIGSEPLQIDHDWTIEPLLKNWRNMPPGEALRIVRDQIAANPHHHDQRAWLNLDGTQVDDCGTSACVAGWATLLAGYNDFKDDYYVRDFGPGAPFLPTVSHVAADVLKLDDELDHPGRLFWNSEMSTVETLALMDTIIAELENTK